MKRLMTFPGSFCPPTYSHYEIVREAADIFPDGITIVSSENPDKDNWFTQAERAVMWSAYNLPSNVAISTLDQLQREAIDFSQLVMIRGIRNEDDYWHEQKVMKLNFDKFGINKYFYLMTQGKFRELSSSRARQAAQNLNLSDLAECVAPGIVSRLLEYILQAKNIFLVVGRPGSGKSTWLKQVCQVDESAYHIDGDDLSRELRPHLEAAFPDQDLYQMALYHEPELLKVLAPKWLELLRAKLRQVPVGKNIYIEAAYGLEENKRLYRFTGHKVIYVGCHHPEVNRQRIAARQTNQHLPFVEKIPDLNQSVSIAASERLALTTIDSSGTIEDLSQTAQDFVNNLKRRYQE